MKTLILSVESNSESSAKQIELNFVDFELGVGLKFQYRLFNANGFSFDGGIVYLDGVDFQKWPEAPIGNEEEFDEKYIVSRILNKLNLKETTISDKSV